MSTYFDFSTESFFYVRGRFILKKISLEVSILEHCSNAGAMRKENLIPMRYFLKVLVNRDKFLQVLLEFHIGQTFCAAMKNIHECVHAYWSNFSLYAIFHSLYNT